MDKTLVSIKYKTADGNEICVDVSTSVKELLEQSDRQIRSQRRQDRRYLYNMGFIDCFSDNAMRYPVQEDTADLVVKEESYIQLYTAIGELSQIQRKRLLLHFVENLTYRQIADIEKVDYRTVGHSIKRALEKLQTQLSG